jgi:hypothetical protein
MTNSQRNAYDAAFFIMVLARMKRPARDCKALSSDSVTRIGHPGTPGGGLKTKKKSRPRGGSKFSQGGVKQSGQEPLNVQKLDVPDNAGETLTYG